jgi:hypothetical protein
MGLHGDEWQVWCYTGDSHLPGLMVTSDYRARGWGESEQESAGSSQVAVVFRCWLGGGVGEA